MKSGPESPSSSGDARDRADRRAGTGPIARASSSARAIERSEARRFRVGTIHKFDPAPDAFFGTIIDYTRRFARSALIGWNAVGTFDRRGHGHSRSRLWGASAMSDDDDDDDDDDARLKELCDEFEELCHKLRYHQKECAPVASSRASTPLHRVVPCLSLIHI